MSSNTDSLSITGILKEKFQEQQISERFRKREFIVQIGGQYPQDILFELTQDRVDLIDPYAEGEEITVDFNLRGREYTDRNGERRFGNQLQAWRLTRV